MPDFQEGTAPDVLQGCCDFFHLGQKGYRLIRGWTWKPTSIARRCHWDQAQYRALFTRSGVQSGLPKYHGGGVDDNRDS